ncbi:MAG: hypothetical protein K2I96_21830 [Lachnospiraceae bacterium]|nr:hypothetical protein [Lachnospiraceae bacterium]
MEERRREAFFWGLGELRGNKIHCQKEAFFWGLGELWGSKIRCRREAFL